MRTIKKLLTITLFSALAIGYLHRQSVNANDNNGFVRFFPPHPISLQNAKQLSDKLTYIAGLDDNHLYLATIRDPSKLVVLRHDLSTVDTMKFRLPKKVNRRIARIQVEGKTTYLVDGTAPAIYRSPTSGGAFQRFMYDSAYFLQAVNISPHAFALRSVMQHPKENVIIKESAAQTHLTYGQNILKKQIDGLFCTDGILLYNRQHQRLFHVYHYRNELIAMDSNLTVLHRGKTIDTISITRINVSKTKDGHSATFSSPPFLVNRLADSDGESLLIQSTVKSSNQTEAQWINFSTVDLYDPTTLTYHFSFSIPDYLGQKCVAFRKMGYFLIVLYPSTLVSYRLNQRLFELQATRHAQPETSINQRSSKHER